MLLKCCKSKNMYFRLVGQVRFHFISLDQPLKFCVPPRETADVGGIEVYWQSVLMK